MPVHSRPLIRQGSSIPRALRSALGYHRSPRWGWESGLHRSVSHQAIFEGRSATAEQSVGRVSTRRRECDGFPFRSASFGSDTTFGDAAPQNVRGYCPRWLFRDRQIGNFF